MSERVAIVGAREHPDLERDAWASRRVIEALTFRRDAWLRDARCERADGNHDAARSCFAVARAFKDALRTIKQAERFRRPVEIVRGAESEAREVLREVTATPLESPSHRDP